MEDVFLGDRRREIWEEGMEMYMNSCCTWFNTTDWPPLQRKLCLKWVCGKSNSFVRCTNRARKCSQVKTMSEGDRERKNNNKRKKEKMHYSKQTKEQQCNNLFISYIFCIYLVFTSSLDLFLLMWSAYFFTYSLPSSSGWIHTSSSNSVSSSITLQSSAATYQYTDLYV